MAIEFEAPIEGMTLTGFGQNQATIENRLLEQFPTVSYQDPSNWDDYAIVGDAAGDYLRTRTSPTGTNARKSWTALVTQRDTYYLRYSFYMEPTGGSNHPSDEGFDWGNGNQATPKTWSTGGKMPGLMKGSPGDNTGGIIDGTVFSGRLMWRGVNSAGIGGNARTSVTMSLYFYGQDANGETNLGAANTYWFVGSHSTDPTRFGSNGGTTTGTGNGQYGDPRAWDVPVGKWVDLLLGYHVPDSSNGWFKAWSRVDGVDTTWQEQLHLPNMRWMDPGNNGIDGFLYQNFWGGATADWYPDNTTYMRFKNFGLYTTELEGREAFGSASTTPYETTTPADGATNVTTPVTPSGTEPDDGATVRQFRVYNETAASEVSAFGAVGVTYDSNTETWVADGSVAIPQNGETIRTEIRRWP